MKDVNAPGFDPHHLAGVYVLDALEPEEAVFFEEHLLTCEICQVEVIEFRETAALLALASAQAAPRRLRHWLATVRQIAQESAVQSRRRAPSFLGRYEDHLARLSKVFDTVNEETEQRKHA